MNALSNKSEPLGHGNPLEGVSLSYTLPEVKSLVPRVNFKRIKLSGFQNLYKQFSSTNFIKVSLSDAVFPLEMPVRKTYSLSEDTVGSVNPLRKKIDKDEIQIPVSLPEELEAQSEAEVIEEMLEEEQVKIEEKKDVTFNLESQIVQEEESVIISPEVVTKEASLENIVSTSEEGKSFIWPPKPEIKSKSENVEIKEEKKEELAKKDKLKKKPYFLNDLSAKKAEEPAKPQKTENKLPWETKETKYEGLEDIFSGGLESELVDESAKEDSVKSESVLIEEENEIVKVKQSPEPEIQKIPEEIPFLATDIESSVSKHPAIPIFKALIPNVPEPLLPDSIKESLNIKGTKGTTFWSEINKVDLRKDTARGANKMLQNSGGSKLTPVRIVLAGGVAATIGYLFWTYALPNFYKTGSGYGENEKVVVRDFFGNKSKNAELQKQSEKLAESGQRGLSEKQLFKPITDDERNSLILKARESLENRTDPFGQDVILQPIIEQKAKEEAKEKSPPEIPLQRKQVELVGVISANNKNLALINVYSADYSVSVEDDKAARETKLKTVLSMAVPNRTEVSILDPLEDWYVKQISKSKSRSEDPTVELVKGDKKFTLRVGQRVLFPEEKSFEQIKQEFIAKQEVLEAAEATVQGTPSSK